MYTPTHLLTSFISISRAELERAAEEKANIEFSPQAMMGSRDAELSQLQQELSTLSEAKGRLEESLLSQQQQQQKEQPSQQQQRLIDDKEKVLEAVRKEKDRLERRVGEMEGALKGQMDEALKRERSVWEKERSEKEGDQLEVQQQIAIAAVVEEKEAEIRELKARLEALEDEKKGLEFR